jgi:hypothetical protein
VTYGKPGGARFFTRAGFAEKIIANARTHPRAVTLSAACGKGNIVALTFFYFSTQLEGDARSLPNQK